MKKIIEIAKDPETQAFIFTVLMLLCIVMFAVDVFLSAG